MWKDQAHGISVFLTFKYDLGGSIADTDGLSAVLRGLIGEPQVDAVLLRSWNLSYLAGHAPVQWCELPEGETRLSGVRWTYVRRLRVYPWLGVASVDYVLSCTQRQPDLSGFYDDLVTWKNQDYLPYLQASEALNDSLRYQLPHSHEQVGTDLHGTVIRGLQRAVAPLVGPRPFLYAFHDFRLCFIGTESELPEDLIRRLLWLSTRVLGLDAKGAVDLQRFGELEIASSGWSTVIRSRSGVSEGQIDVIITLLNLIHAQWFVCQLWINAHNLRGQARNSEWQLANAHVLSANQLALAQDLSEVENLNVMLKDPGLLRVANFLEEHMEVRKHRETAMSRLRALENHSRQLADYKSDVELRRFQALFAISAAAGVASLVPALAQVGFSKIHSITTMLPLFGLWGLFAIDFTVVRRRWRARRERIRAGRQPRSAGDQSARLGAAEEHSG